MKLVVGLGNPESKYANTRHNLGFEVLEELTRKLNLVDWTKEDKLKSELIKTPELILAKSLTFMNQSGLAVRQLADYYKMAPEDIIVIYDALDLPLG